MHESHDHNACIQDALDEAERICTERGTRFTKLRRQVLQMVWQGHKAVKAYDLLDQLAAEGGSAKPPTVYRALDFLMEEGFVHKIQSLNAYVGCPHPGKSHVSQFLICDSCSGIEEVTSEQMTREIELAAKRAQFKISSQTVELHGTCRSCA
ncbi:transcriptional repressor [Kordiimonas sediminis]|uniref:Transcriptional repressor n=1 Tax=Kordiimonas sediminis TaxID=1735581 RepID=A0A919AXK9_9PROT|nr:transcriptional repressor [Kordiimonas sediminis]GHF30589.1 transcriptional repressor [Kordiimonas sediminis]